MQQNDSKKILTMSFLGAGALIAFVFHVITNTLMPITSGAVARAISSDFVVYILPVLVGFAGFLLLQFNKQVVAWGDEVVVEIKKVVSPSRRDTVAMTIVVIIMVMISAVIISIFDFLSSQLINYIVKL